MKMNRHMASIPLEQRDCKIFENYRIDINLLGLRVFVVLSNTVKYNFLYGPPHVS